MVRTDEDALICDFAETYHIFDYREELSCQKAALLAVGLRATSRIKTKMAGFTQPLDVFLIASCLDHLKVITWMQTEDAQKHINFPDSIAAKFVLSDNEQQDVECSIDEFEAWRDSILEG